MTLKIETERLVLSPLEARHVDDHIEMMADPDIARFLSPSGAPEPRANRWRSVASYIGHWHIRGFGFFAVEEKSTGAFVGRVGPWMPEGWPALECGWGIARVHWGKGYAPEAAIAAINWTFETFPELTRIISVIDPDNANSQAVARKIGETNTRETFEPFGSPLDIWAASRAQWLEKFGR